MGLAWRATNIMLIIEDGTMRRSTYLTSFSKISFMKRIHTLTDEYPCLEGWRYIECRVWMQFWSSPIARFATISRSKLVIGSSFRNFFCTLLSGILDPTAPLVKAGTCSMAAGLD